MAQPPLDLYVYLLKRDKKGVRIISRVKGKPLIPTRITDIGELNLPSHLTEGLRFIISESKLMWEPWAETTDNFENLRASIKKRGYINIPASSQPEFRYSGAELPVANVSKIDRQSVMLQNAHPSRPYV